MRNTLLALSFVIGSTSQAVTLTKGTKVFDEYKNLVAVEKLAEGDCITVTEAGIDFDAEIYDVTSNQGSVSFSVVDFEEDSIKLASAPKKHSKRVARIQLNSLIIPGALLAMSTLPGAEAGPFGAAVVAIVGTATATAVAVAGIASGAGAAAGAAAATEIMHATAAGVVIAAAVPAP